MTQLTHPLPESSELDKTLEISPQFSLTRALGYLAATVGVICVCSLPFAYLTISHGFWKSGTNEVDFRPVLLALYVTVAIAVSVLAITAGLAAGAGKPWSRFGMMLYADLSIVIAIVGVLPVYLFVIRQPSMDWGLRHAIELVVVLKAWIVELPLAVAILYRFTRPGVLSAYQHPEVEAPDRSNR